MRTEYCHYLESECKERRTNNICAAYVRNKSNYCGGQEEEVDMIINGNESNELPVVSMMGRIKKIKEDKIKAGEKPPFFHVLPNKEVQQLMFEAKKMGMVIGMDLEKFGEVDRFMWKVPMMVGKIDDVYIIETVSPSKKEREQSKRYEETVFKVMNILSEDDYSKDTRYSMIKDVIDKCMEDL